MVKCIYYPDFHRIEGVLEGKDPLRVGIREIIEIRNGRYAIKTGRKRLRKIEEEQLIELGLEVKIRDDNGLVLIFDRPNSNLAFV